MVIPTSVPVSFVTVVSEQPSVTMETSAESQSTTTIEEILIRLAKQQEEMRKHLQTKSRKEEERWVQYGQQLHNLNH